MSIFYYRALEPQGGEVTGFVEAQDQKDAYEQLSAKKLAPFELREKQEQLSFQLRKPKLTQKELSRYLRQLATLLSANVTILEALTTLSRNRSNLLLAERNQNILSDLRGGKRFTLSLEESIPELPDYVFRLADLGEATGSLARSLTDAADRMEYEQRVRSDVRSALTYPTFLISVGSIIIILMFVLVVPRFANILGNDFSNAPWISQIVIKSGLWMKAHIWFFFTILGGGIAAIVFAVRQENVRAGTRVFLEKTPLVGSMLRTTDLGGWCRTVGVAILNKAQLVDALVLGEDGVQSIPFRRQLKRARALVRSGRPLEEALQETDPEFEPMVLDLIRTGRNSGALGDMLVFSADLYEKEARETTKKITALAEPMAIVGIALIVGVIVISIVLAMTSLYEFSF